MLSSSNISSLFIRSTSFLISFISLSIKLWIFLSRTISRFSSLFLVSALIYKSFFSRRILSISTAPRFRVRESSYIFIFFFSYSFSAISSSSNALDSLIIEKELWDLLLLALRPSSWSFMLLIASVIFSFSQRSFSGNVNGKWNLNHAANTSFVFRIESGRVCY